MESVDEMKYIKQDFSEGEFSKKHLIEDCALHTLGSDWNSSSFFVSDNGTSEIS